MADIKNIISFLCKHLNRLFNMNIKPEMFRLAKFNKSDDNVVKVFWTVLSNVVELSESENVVENVKRYFLMELNYDNVHFYSLPENMSYGSRELLIALGYLLANDHLNKFIKNAILSSPLNPNHSLANINDNVEYKTENYSFSLYHIKTESDFEHALQWIEGRMDYNKRAVAEYENCSTKMLEKISKVNLCSMPNIDELTLSEVLALNNTEYAKEYLEKTESVAKIMQNHEHWIKNQAVFWKWMSSVLLEKHKDARGVNVEEINKLLAALI